MNLEPKWSLELWEYQPQLSGSVVIMYHFNTRLKKAVLNEIDHNRKVSK